MEGEKRETRHKSVPRRNDAAENESNSAAKRSETESFLLFLSFDFPTVPIRPHDLDDDTVPFLAISLSLSSLYSLYGNDFQFRVDKTS